MILWDWLEAEDRELKKKAVKEGLKEGLKEGMKQGMKETILATIQRMLQFGENDDNIRKYTGATKKDIEEAKKLLAAKG